MGQTETLPAPEVEEAPLTGEVLTAEEIAEIEEKREALAGLEAIADQGIEALTGAMVAGVAARNIAGLAIRRIQVQGLWKFAQNPDDEGAHFTSFGAYAKSRFGWQQTYGRLSQVTTAAVIAAHDEGAISDEEYEALAPKPSGSSSGVKAINPDRALLTTLKSLEKQQDNLATRMDSEPVKADKELTKVLRKVNNQLASSIEALEALANERNLLDETGDADAEAESDES